MNTTNLIHTDHFRLTKKPKEKILNLKN